MTGLSEQTVAKKQSPRGRRPSVNAGEPGDMSSIVLRLPKAFHAEVARYAREQCKVSMNEFCVQAVLEKVQRAKQDLLMIRSYWTRIKASDATEILADARRIAEHAGYTIPHVPFVVAADLALDPAVATWPEFVTLWPMLSGEKQSQLLNRAFLASR